MSAQFWMAIILVCVTWGPKIVLGGAFAYAGYSFYKKIPLYKNALIGMAFTRVLYAGIATAGQYIGWSQNAFTKLLLPPHQSIGYFILYVVGRLWINVGLSIIAGYVFYLFLRALKRHNERFFEEGEVELGAFIALIIGWPGFVLFVPFLFGAVVLVSVFKMLFMKEKFTTFGVPFFIAALPLLAFCIQLIDLFHLGVFKI